MNSEINTPINTTNTAIFEYYALRNGLSLDKYQKYYTSKETLQALHWFKLGLNVVSPSHLDIFNAREELAEKIDFKDAEIIEYFSTYIETRLKQIDTENIISTYEYGESTKNFLLAKYTNSLKELSKLCSLKYLVSGIEEYRNLRNGKKLRTALDVVNTQNLRASQDCTIERAQIIHMFKSVIEELLECSRDGIRLSEHGLDTMLGFR